MSTDHDHGKTIKRPIEHLCKKADTQYREEKTYIDKACSRPGHANKDETVLKERERGRAGHEEEFVCVRGREGVQRCDEKVREKAVMATRWERN